MARKNVGEVKQLEQAIDIIIGLLDVRDVRECPLVQEELSRLELSFHRRLREISRTKSINKAKSEKEKKKTGVSTAADGGEKQTSQTVMVEDETNSLGGQDG